MLCRLACFLAVLLAAACQTVSLNSAQDHTAGNGIVAFRYAINGAQPIAFHDPWDFVEIEGDDGSSLTFNPVYDGISRTALYVGSVPPGRYRFTEFSGRIGGVSGRPNDKLGKFNVEAGRVTYLGTLVQQVDELRVSFPGTGTRNLLVYDPNPSPDGLPEILDILFPGLSGVDRNPQSFIGWDPETVPDAAGPALYAEIRKASRGLIDPVELSDGSVAFGSLLGQLRLWHPDAGWRRVDIGVNRAIEAFAELSPGVWLVGGEMGSLRLTTDEGRTWKDAGIPLPYGVVQDIYTMPDGYIYITHYRGTQFTLYRGKMGGGPWQVIQSARFAAPGQLYGSTPQRMKTYRFGSVLYTTLPHSNLAVFDTATGVAEIRDMPGPFNHMQLSNDGVLRGNFEQFIIWNPLESRDGGKSWEGSTHSRAMLPPAFKDGSFGMGVELQPGFTSGTAYLSQTEDGGKTWERTREFFLSTIWMGYARRTDAFYAYDRVRTLFVSRDGGKTWKEDSSDAPITGS